MYETCSSNKKKTAGLCRTRRPYLHHKIVLIFLFTAFYQIKLHENTAPAIAVNLVQYRSKVKVCTGKEFFQQFGEL